MKSEQWVADRELLRGRIKMQKPSGAFATFLYCLVSHMRGKLHMRWYGKYRGGFSTKYREAAVKDRKGRDISMVPSEVQRAYTGFEKEFFSRCAVESLSDQAAWIKQFLEERENSLSSDLEEIAERVVKLGSYDTPLQKTG